MWSTEIREKIKNKMYWASGEKVSKVEDKQKELPGW